MADKTVSTTDAETVNRLVAEYSAKVQGFINDALDSGRKVEESIGQAVFNALRACTGPDFAKTVIGHCVRDWQKRNTFDVDGVSTLPKPSASFRSTLSTLVRQWADAPAHRDAYLHYIVQAMPGAEADVPPTFLDLRAERYSGPKACKLWRSDFEKTERAIKAAAAAKKEAQKEAAKLLPAGSAPAGSGATAQGMASGTAGKPLPKVVSEALEAINRVIQFTINAGVLSDDRKAQILNMGYLAITEQLAKHTTEQVEITAEDEKILAEAVAETEAEQIA